MEGMFFPGDEEFCVRHIESEMSIRDIQVEMLSISLKLSGRDIAKL